jgi:hypothetical protein
MRNLLVCRHIQVSVEVLGSKMLQYLHRKFPCALSEALIGFRPTYVIIIIMIIIIINVVCRDVDVFGARNVLLCRLL